ncbi:monophosphate kinase [Moumouvirus goulette]|uniref:Monophosphate kinase n=1 Tax=Moumouvirus goulette TaxID=1247379 RepID=M1PBA0_9VIRU|nr:monophosphate kinase [Moumouvirus goulette]AGF85184.1 monophosphate kinase [Moumouvirus goulette]
MGNAGSGKTTFADFIVKKYGFIEKSFADPLKKACKELFLFEDHQVYGTQEQKETPDPRWFNCTPRTVLQFVGTELFRDNLERIMPGLGKDIFIYHFKLWYQQELQKNPDIRVVVSDIRFQNEADFIKSLGGTVIKISKEPSKTNLLKKVLSNFIVNQTDTHASEKELKNINNYDILIENTGTIDDYYKKITEVTYNIISING